MKFRTDKDILQFLGMGLGTVALGAILLVFFHAKAGVIFIMSGTLTVLVGLSLATKSKDFLKQDERSIRINEKAGNYAFWAIMTVILAMYVLRAARLLNPDFMDAYSTVFFTGIYGNLIMRWHFNRKGE
ncbi:MAG: hypothetical protein MPEBLZ_03286 [Candidatus Methanoperedens nitroreducens]|uniref:DUF2178 domain-containing protein n=1 Tax=Candidatus Methanoperedens nitratireducens TaxID=1392998 RepID=A0A0P8A6G8_9EURY|nr:hypothetical protein [Candidatus Methanoperedens sp. BLZ2]KAB2945609.1 MAG: hypothetical protein F9K14_10140 [Candidatus Methanoperedens sp.]KPQ42159.1 MAG: hypothetical protein MPEBLZ_03286 [Candidatus Methanoperedens sp. BLZ1]MBZ0176099.1 hypothetical protein [Candidatus Methanoperedens nitroreducens]MCX9079378.1 hypothetical protein [Candidatus Methanoperedens sp.]MCX9087598.1 hypothetical protein [Candidatus Methanoperedens sp.]